jgi:two-component system, cell cycle response regulator DivK
MPSTQNNPLSVDQISASLKDKTILIVEDNIGNFMLIARMLSNYGARCEWKTSGYEVVEFARTLLHLDLVLMDIHLPYEDGYAAMRKIRQSGTLKQIPIIAVTADTGLNQMHNAQIAGFNGFIGKPLNPDRFPEQISRIFSNEPVWEYN